MGASLVTTQYRSGHYWIEIDGSLLFSMTRQHPEWRGDRDTQLHGSLVFYTRLIDEVRWTSPFVRFPYGWYSSRRRAHETISTCSFHLAPISFKVYFASSNRVGSSTVPKQTETPRASSIRGVAMFDGKVPAVVRRMGLNVQKVLIERLESFVEVFSKGLGMRTRRVLLR